MYESMMHQRYPSYQTIKCSENASMHPKQQVILFSCSQYAQYATCKHVNAVLRVSEGQHNRYTVAKGVRSAVKSPEAVRSSLK
jgi:hypothetical protein